MTNPSTRLFTIGHSNHEPARLIELLRSASITAVVDVRSSPFSQRLPHFNRPELERTLKQQGLAYVFLGEELGGRPAHEGVYTAEGRVDYERVRQTADFREGIDRVLRGLERYTIALLCAEEDPLNCHRGLMIAPALVERGIDPAHVRGNGDIEPRAAFEDRLFAETGVGAGMVDGLFSGMLTEEDHRELLAEAYRVQARRKAFRMPTGEPGDDSE